MILLYLWTGILSFGGLAFAVFPWQIVLAVDLFATLVMGLVTAWPYLDPAGRRDAGVTSVRQYFYLV